ncbi:hypothetical protein [Streptomyces sp. NPDC002490]|uniref:hypothetical protein n=1 Tax=Streptomyces sp. NPDC002490 TaxID=3154416 RepID=UPI003323950A
MRGGVGVGAGALAAVVLLAGCGGSGDGSGKGGSEGPGERKPSAVKKAAPLDVPPGYRSAQGWDETLAWVPRSVFTIPAEVTEDQVGAMQASSDGYTVRVRDAADGKVRWTSAAWQPPTPVEGAEGGPESDDARVEIPGLSTVEIDGSDHFVAWAHGLRGKDELHEGTEILRLAVYPADARGTGVKPLREIDVPLSASPGEFDLHGGQDGRLLVSWGDDGPFPSSTAVVDLVSGKVTVHEDSDTLLPECAEQLSCVGGRVVGVADGTPLVTVDGGGFGLAGRWHSDAVIPPGAPKTSGWSPNGLVYGTTDGRVLAAWRPKPFAEGEAAHPVWSVHDMRTGQLLASMRCANEVPQSARGKRDSGVGTSLNGRFLFAGPVTFDLERKKGLCLAGDGNRKTVLVASVDDRGAAYGAVERSADTETSTLVRLDLTAPAGSPEPLDPGTEVPIAMDLKGHGLFITRDENEAVLISLRRRS